MYLCAYSEKAKQSLRTTSCRGILINMARYVYSRISELFQAKSLEAATFPLKFLEYCMVYSNIAEKQNKIRLTRPVRVSLILVIPH
jgi:hypothetical protein